MTIRRSGLIGLAAFVLSVFSSSLAEACSPAHLTSQEIIDRADLIVIANATGSKWEVGEYKPGVINKILEMLGQMMAGADSRTQGKTRFAVLRTLKGSVGDHILVNHDVSPESCGVTFNSYDNYLLFVSEQKNRYFISVFGVRPFLSPEEYAELIELLGVTAKDHVARYDDYLEAIDAQ